VHFELTHPGAVLKEELAARGLTANALAIKLRIAPQRLQEIVAGRRAISPDTALRLGRFFGNEPEFWLAMQTHYDLARARAENGAKIDAEVEVAA
jgi:addiction module HigA family antidote